MNVFDRPSPPAGSFHSQGGLNYGGVSRSPPYGPDGGFYSPFLWEAGGDSGGGGSANELLPPHSFHGNPSAPAAPKSIKLDPFPSVRAPKYEHILPNDCEGLIFALEGKFQGGDEVVCDAAQSILTALIERETKIFASNLEGLNRPRIKAQVLKSLENSWLTSTFLAHRLTCIAGQYLDSIEARLMKGSQKNGEGCSVVTPSSSLFEDLVVFDGECLKPEALITLIQILERWAHIRSALGLFSGPFPPRAKQQPPPPRPPVVSRLKIVQEPPPRPVGRPRLRRAMSMADFVDTLESAALLPIPQPPIKTNFAEALGRVLIRYCLLWGHIMKIAEREAFSRRAAETASFADDQSASQQLFDDPSIGDLFLESLKEAEFIAWREKRRQSVSGPTSEGTSRRSASIPGVGGSFEDALLEETGLTALELETRIIEHTRKLLNADIAVRCPLVLHSCLGLKSALELANSIGKLDGNAASEALTPMVITTWIELCSICSGKIPLVSKYIGSSLVETILQMGWKFGMATSRHTHLISVTFGVAIHILACFVRFISLELFPHVASRVAETFKATSIYPGDAQYLPVDVPTARMLIGLDEIECPKRFGEVTGSDVNTVVSTITFTAFAGAVVYGRLHGLVFEPPSCCVSDVGGDPGAADRQTLDALISNLPDTLQDKVSSIIQNHRPQLGLGGFRSRGSETPQRDTFCTPPLYAEAPNIVPSSYTGVMGAGMKHSASKLEQEPTYGGGIDTAIETPKFYTAPEFARQFSDIVATCSTCLLTFVEESQEAREALLRLLPVLQQIVLLSRSPTLAALIKAVETGGNVGGERAGGYMDDDPICDLHLLSK